MSANRRKNNEAILLINLREWIVAIVVFYFFIFVCVCVFGVCSILSQCTDFMRDHYPGLQAIHVPLYTGNHNIVFTNICSER